MKAAHSNVQNMVLTARDESPSKFDIAKLAELRGKAGPNCLANDVLVKGCAAHFGQARELLPGGHSCINAISPSRIGPLSSTA